MDLNDFLLDAQKDLLVAAVSLDEATSSQRRDAVTAAFSGVFERLAEQLRPRIVVEVGAHEASFSRFLAGRLPDARVLAFEAHPRVYAKYRAVCAEAGVDYRNACVAGRSGLVSLKVPLREDASERLFMGSLLADSMSSEMQTYEVEAVTLDEALGPDVVRPSVIWIDVEGAVDQVLAGAGRTLAHSVAVYVEVETLARWTGQILAPEVSRRLAAHGLRPVLRDVQRSSGGREWQYNVLYIREDLLAAAREPARRGARPTALESLRKRLFGS